MNASIRRDSSLDFISGILIVYMIFLHILQWSHLSIEVYSKVLFFFMPWFFFKSGMFSNNAERKDKKSFKDYFIKCFKRLLVPFIIFSLIGQLLYCIELCISGNLSQLRPIIWLKALIAGGALPGNLPLWFLFTFFGVKIVAKLLIPTIKTIVPILLLFSVLAFISYFYSIRPIYVGNICSGLVFYYIGQLLKDVQYKDYVFYSSIILMLFIAVVSPVYVDMHMNNVMFYSSANEYKKFQYFIWIPFSVFSIIVADNIAKYIDRFFSGSIIYRLFVIVGKDSMNYLVLHWPVLIVCKMFLFDICRFTISNGLYFILMTVSCAMLLPLLSKFINRMPKLSFTVGK